jgi:hypothetical protein
MISHVLIRRTRNCEQGEPNAPWVTNLPQRSARKPQEVFKISNLTIVKISPRHVMMTYICPATHVKPSPLGRFDLAAFLGSCEAPSSPEMLLTPGFEF